MIVAQFRPLEQPLSRPKSGHKSCPFRGSFTNTLDTLEREINWLRGKDIIIQIDTSLDQIRNDGWPRSTARPKTPGVVVSFTSSRGSLCFRCNTYGDWESNLRGIALGMERLRAVDRYGITSGAEQYQGFSALPPGRPPIAGGEWATVEDAMRFLCKVGDGVVLSVLPADLTRVYREAAKKAHPDVTRDNGELMSKVNRARDFVEEHRGA